VDDLGEAILFIALLIALIADGHDGRIVAGERAPAVAGDLYDSEMIAPRILAIIALHLGDLPIVSLQRGGEGYMGAQNSPAAYNL
jgi:hypothetical protein